MTQTANMLLVEDNKDDELLMLDALRAAGVPNHVFVVRDGQEALDYLFVEGSFATRDRTDKPCVILLDLKLPKISGIEVLKRIKTDERTKRLPVVVLTTSSEREDIHNCYGNGANSYVRKPVEFEKFLEAIRYMGLYWTAVNEPAS
ncbi:MAG: response regulator [Acidobacteriia bacterium]|nr:response regulator [Terriglobia bacterium]MBV9744196.1 response regulator [Terriglobia bacterium]